AKGVGVRAGDEFFNLYNHDFVRVAVAMPSVRVADPVFNGDQTLALMAEASAQYAVLAMFPELGLSAYSCEDLFHQRALLDACQQALQTLLAASEGFPLVGVVGMPLELDHRLYNCGVVVSRGR